MYLFLSYFFSLIVYNFSLFLFFCKINFEKYLFYVYYYFLLFLF